MIRIGITGLIAYEAAEKLVNDNRGDIEKHFSRRFMKAFDALADLMPDTHSMAGDNTYGGLFGTLWRAMDALEESHDHQTRENTDWLQRPVGCVIKLEDIPVRQEIVEICELHNENPYEADSAGAYLVIWNEDFPSQMECFHMGNPSLDSTDISLSTEDIVPIGYIAKSKDRLIINGDMIRYLTPYRRQMSDIAARKNDRRL